MKHDSRAIFSRMIAELEHCIEVTKANNGDIPDRFPEVWIEPFTPRFKQSTEALRWTRPNRVKIPHFNDPTIEEALDTFAAKHEIVEAVGDGDKTAEFRIDEAASMVDAPVRLTGSILQGVYETVFNDAVRIVWADPFAGLLDAEDALRSRISMIEGRVDESDDYNGTRYDVIRFEPDGIVLGVRAGQKAGRDWSGSMEVLYLYQEEKFNYEQIVAVPRQETTLPNAFESAYIQTDGFGHIEWLEIPTGDEGIKNIPEGTAQVVIVFASRKQSLRFLDEYGREVGKRELKDHNIDTINGRGYRIEYSDTGLIESIEFVPEDQQSKIKQVEKQFIEEDGPIDINIMQEPFS